MDKTENGNRLYLIAGKSVENCVKNKKINVSIDQITLIAPISLEAWEKHVNRWLMLPFVRVSGSGIKVVDTDNCYVDDYKNEHEYVEPEQIAFIEMPKYHTDEIRIDFNPNHGMDTAGGQWLKSILEKLPNKHFSRLDIAIDMFNYPEIEKYDLWQYGMTKKLYFGRQQKIETKYWGSRSSLKQVRLYDKKIEQKQRHGKIVYANSWWRLEFQLRGKIIQQYPKIVNEMLNNFYVPDYKSSKLTDSQQNKVLRAMIDSDYYGGLKRSSQQQLRKLIRLAKPDNSLSTVLQVAFEDNLYSITEELQYYLDYFGIANVSNELPTKNG